MFFLGGAKKGGGAGAHSSASRGRCWPASSSSIGPVRPGSWRAKALGCRMLPRSLLLPLCAANQAPLFFTSTFSVAILSEQKMNRPQAHGTH